MTCTVITKWLFMSEKKNHEHACKAQCSGEWTLTFLEEKVASNITQSSCRYLRSKDKVQLCLYQNYWEKSTLTQLVRNSGFVWFESIIQLESACWKYQQELLHATRPTVRGILANWWYPNKPNYRLAGQRDQLAQYTTLQTFFFFPWFFLYLNSSPSSYHKFENTLCRHIQGIRPTEPAR